MDRKTLIAQTALQVVGLMMVRGLSYREGIMCVGITQHAMDRVNENPDIEDSVLVAELEAMIYV